jgi:hypothetical protein
MKLEDRLQRAGDQLDAASTEYRRHRPLDEAPSIRTARRPVRRLALAAAALAVVATASVAILADGDTSTEVTAGVDPTLGDAGALLTGDGLLDLATGTVDGAAPTGWDLTNRPFKGVPGPGGELVYYSSQAGPDEPGGDGTSSRPEIRVRNRSEGTDEQLVEGSTSFAVSATGRIAYNRATDPDQPPDMEGRSVNEVVVQDSVTAEPTTWSAEPSDYRVWAWAGDRLLVQHLNEPAENDLLVFDGAGTSRVLVAGAWLLGLSPDGSTALVHQHSPPIDLGSSVLLVDIASGAARPVDLGGLVIEDYETAVSWVGDTLVMTRNLTDESTNQLLIFAVGSGPDGPTLQFERAVPVGPAGAFAHDVWLDDDGSTFRVLVARYYDLSMGGEPRALPYRIDTCDATGTTCEQRELPLTTDDTVTRLRNPSRPLPDGLPVEAG